MKEPPYIPASPGLFLGKSQGRRSLLGCNPWGRSESDMTERLHFHFSLSCIGEGNGNPLQCSCLENPGDAGAWWAAVYGVAQSRTRLKQLSSSSSSSSSSTMKNLPSFRFPECPIFHFQKAPKITFVHSFEFQPFCCHLTPKLLFTQYFSLYIFILNLALRKKLSITIKNVKPVCLLETKT